MKQKHLSRQSILSFGELKETESSDESTDYNAKSDFAFK